MTACFLNCMWRMSKILRNQGFPAFIEMINIQQSNYMLGTNDLLSTEHSPALLDFAEVCNTDLKGRKKNQKHPIRFKKVPRYFQNYIPILNFLWVKGSTDSQFFSADGMIRPTLIFEVVRMTASIKCSCKSTVVSYKENPGNGTRFPGW